MNDTTTARQCLSKAVGLGVRDAQVNKIVVDLTEVHGALTEQYQATAKILLTLPNLIKLTPPNKASDYADKLLSLSQGLANFAEDLKTIRSKWDGTICKLGIEDAAIKAWEPTTNYSTLGDVMSDIIFPEAQALHLAVLEDQPKVEEK